MASNRLLSVLLAIVAALVLAACGSDSGGGSSDKSGAAVGLDQGPATLAPANSPLYVEANITPQGDQADALDELVANVSDGKVTDARAEIVKALNKELGDNDISYEQDIAPWLGSSAAIFASSLKSLSDGSSLNTDPSDFQGAVVLETTDAAKASAFADEIAGPGSKAKSYGGTDYKVSSSKPVAAGVIEDKYLVAGDEASYKQAVDTASGSSSLAKDPDFQKAVKATPGGLIFGYIDSEGLEQSAKQTASSNQTAGTLAQSGMLDMLFGQFDAIAFGAGVEDDAIKIDSAVIGSAKQPTDAGDLLEEMPAEAFAAFGVGDIGDQAKQLVEQINRLDPNGELESHLKSMGIDLDGDVFSWMGDAAGFVQGDSQRNLNAALVIETSDPAKTKSLITQIKPLLNLAQAAAGDSSDIKVEPLTGAEADDGFKVRTKEVPFPISIGVKRDRFVIAVGDDALAEALGSKQQLGDTAAFKAATDQLDDGVDPMLYADVPQLLKLVENLAGDDAQFGKVAPYLDAFQQLSAGTKSTDGATTSQIVIGVKDRD